MYTSQPITAQLFFQEELSLVERCIFSCLISTRLGSLTVRWQIYGSFQSKKFSPVILQGKVWMLKVEKREGILEEYSPPSETDSGLFAVKTDKYLSSLAKLPGVWAIITLAL